VGAPGAQRLPARPFRCARRPGLRSTGTFYLFAHSEFKFYFLIDGAPSTPALRAQRPHCAASLRFRKTIWTKRSICA